MKRILWLFLIIVPAAFAGELREGDLVAICGDSITEQKLYSVYIADYLLMCQPAPKLRVMQFGWGGEKAQGFFERMRNELLPFQPNIVTTCYGMNDGGYGPMSPEKGTRYRAPLTKIVEECKKAGARQVIVGSPGCVDADTYKRGGGAAEYNPTLAALGDIAREIAQTQQVIFADLHTPMMDVMTKAKAKYGNTYHLAGNDGVHPWANGHLVMAYVFLKALRCDGDIGTITIDLAGKRAEASAGHKIVSFKDGAAEIESGRYPFCFSGETNAPSATTGVIEFFPFNEEMNRFRLVVKGASAPRLKVRWGEAEKTFAAADLARGINLAAEFLNNPFGKSFSDIETKIRDRQNLETWLVKGVLHGGPASRAALPDKTAEFDRIQDAALTLGRSDRDTAVVVAPVRHTIIVAPE